MGGLQQLHVERRDVFAVLAFAALAQLEVWFAPRDDGPAAVAAAGALLMTLPLLVRRRAPLAAVLIVTGTQVVQSMLGVPPEAHVYVLVAVVVSVYSLGAHAGLRAAAGGLVAAALSILAADAVRAGPATASAEDLFFLGVFTVGPWLAGRAVRARQERAQGFEKLALQLSREQEERTRAAVAEERTRIARELHDIIAHSVSMMVVQADAARRTLPAGSADAFAALDAIREGGREALAELRHLLGLLREDGAAAVLAPQPNIMQIPTLVDRARAGGLPVQHDVEGDPRPLSPGVEAVAYRVVQEALTNVVKHAGAVPTEVRLRFAESQLEVEVRNARPPEERPESAGGSGQGIIGMRERVALYGGRLRVGWHEDGQFVTHARLPVRKDGS